MRRSLLLAGIVAASVADASAQCLAAKEGSRYDFAAGGATLFETDFSNDEIGDFPAGFEFKQGAMEVAQWQGQRALRASSPSALAIPLSAPLPESFTVEVGVVNRNTKQVGAYTVKIYGGRNFLSDFNTSSTRAVFGTIGWEVTGGGATASADFNSDDAEACIGQETMVRLQVDGSRLKLYADERRLASIPNANFLRARGLVIALEGRDDGENAVYLTRVRVAGGQVVAQRAPASQPAAGGSAPASQPPATAAPASQPPATTAPPASGGAPASSGTNTIQRTPAAARSDARSSHATTADDTPVAPSGVTATAVGDGRVAVVWTPVPNAVSYDVLYQAPGQQPAGANLQPITDVSHVTRALAEGPVQIMVVANFGDGKPSSPRSAPVTVNVPRFMARYRVTINGFRVNAETFDNPAQVDGKRDEIYAQATVQEYEQGVGTAPAKTVRTVTHGDNNHSKWSTSGAPGYRVKAGSASERGGLKTGDAFPSAEPWQRASATNYDFTFPLLVWEGMLIEGFRSVAITPVLYEDDEVKELQPPEVRLFQSFLPLAAKPATATVQVSLGELLVSIAKMRQPISDAVYQAHPTFIGALRARAAGGNAEINQVIQRLQAEMTTFGSHVMATVQVMNNAKDRPIGMETNAAGQLVFHPFVLNLHYEAAEQIVNGQHHLNERPGIVAIRYRDNLPGGTGDYTLYVEVTRVQ